MISPNQSNSGREKHRIMKTDTLGDRMLCSWQVAPGVVWVQTRSPKFANKLSQRSDSKRVARGVAGGYLRIYEFKHGLTWASSLIARYQEAETAANERKTASVCPPELQKVKVVC